MLDEQRAERAQRGGRRVGAVRSSSASGQVESREAAPDAREVGASAARRCGEDGPRRLGAWTERVRETRRPRRSRRRHSGERVTVRLRRSDTREAWWCCPVDGFRAAQSDGACCAPARAPWVSC